MTWRVDAHQHFWTLERKDYGWLTPKLPVLYRDYAPADLEPLLENTGIDRTVLVQAAPSVAETRYLLELADTQEFIAGVVGWVDMESPDAPDVLASLAGHAKFVGIRPMLQDLEDPAWITRPGLETAVRALSTCGLTFDALVRTEHLPHLQELIERHPDLPVVIDHGAKPDIANGVFEPWASRMKAIADESATCCKLSGLVTEAGRAASYDSVVPYLDHLLDVFGPRRLLWGSDWPVLNLAGDYPGWHRAFTAWLDRVDRAAREDILGGNAVRFYGLATTDTGE